MEIKEFKWKKGKEHKMKIYEVKMEKVRSNHDYLRVNSFEGVTLDLPTSGERFRVFVDPTELGVEYVETTTVEKVENIGDEYRVHTTNSEYKITVLGVQGE